MSAFTVGDVRQAALIIGVHISDDHDRQAAADDMALLFGQRFASFDKSAFAELVELAHENPQDYQTRVTPRPRNTRPS